MQANVGSIGENRTWSVPALQRCEGLWVPLSYDYGRAWHEYTPPPSPPILQPRTSKTPFLATGTANQSPIRYDDLFDSRECETYLAGDSLHGLALREQDMESDELVAHIVHVDGVSP